MFVLILIKKILRNMKPDCYGISKIETIFEIPSHPHPQEMLRVLALQKCYDHMCPSLICETFIS